MTYTINNINEFFEDLMNKPNAKLHMYTVYANYESVCENNKKIVEIIKQYNFPSYYYDAVLINEDIAIVIEMKKHEVTGYFAHVNNKKSHTIWPTFEQALLCAVSIKLTGSEDATEWMWKLLAEQKVGLDWMPNIVFVFDCHCLKPITYCNRLVKIKMGKLFKEKNYDSK